MANINFDELLTPGMKGMDSSAIRKVFSLAAKLENPINLSIGQPHFPTPQPIIDALVDAAKEQKTAYTMTQGIAELRQAMAKKYKEQNGFSVSEDNILITSGIAPALLLLFEALISPGDEVLVIEPYFLIYRSLLEFKGAKLSYISENFTKEDLEKINRKFKFVIFSNPSNPTGKVFAKEQLSLLTDFAERNNLLIISDEIYETFDYEKTFVSMASLYENTVTLSGFSKSYSMTGLRLSAVAGPKTLMDKLTTLQQYTIVCAPSVVQWAGLAALQTDISAHIQDYKSKRDFVLSKLQPLKEKGLLHFDKPNGAFYFFLYLKNGQSGMEFVEHAIKEKELLLVPGNIFCRDENTIRLSYAASDETLKKGMQALEDLLL